MFQKIINIIRFIPLSSSTPRWLILIIDLLICSFSILFSFQLRFNLQIPEEYSNDLIKIVSLVVIIRFASFLIFKPFAGIIRYTSVKDTERILMVTLFGTCLLIVVNFISYFFLNGQNIIPNGILLIDFFITVVHMTSYRLIIKTVFAEIKNSTHRKLNVIIYGTGRAGLATKITLEHDSAIRYKVISFLDNQDHNVGKKLEGVHIYSYDKLTDLIDNFSVSMLFFSRKERNQEIRNEITEICLKNDIKVLAVPPANNWIDGELTIPQIKRVKIEDLLERPPIILDPSRINKEVNNKVVLVTGAAGSIGSEIVRQLTQFRASKLILFDQAESPLHLIDLELFERIRYKTYEIEIGDITNKSRLENLFLTYKPDIVFHAAAYKHVPLMEYHPAEAVRTNVSGTKILADLSVKYQVKKFIMISTDKAVNPTSVMGASKRLAEIYIQSLNDFCFTSFITTRFGNVLGSNGSVIPRFRKQIESGGPVTITHPDITRYFMTIPEACQLVLEACAMGQGGEIFIFDMGKSIKIVDLAKKMIRLTGLKLGRDIQIEFTGLRPGEKLFEELLNDKENTTPTYHPKILIAKTRKYNFDKVSVLINELIYKIEDADSVFIVKLMKDMVPEFKSQNSKFTKFDKKEV